MGTTMNKTFTLAATLPFFTGNGLTETDLTALLSALKPEFSKLNDKQKHDLKVAAAAAVAEMAAQSGTTAQEDFQHLFIHIFPIPFPPFPPIFWDKTAVSIQSVAVGLILL